ncbi:hypothetical protein KR009_000516, partial [Drosophila setifemur]
RTTIWYSIGSVVEEPECPSCGRSMQCFKNRPAHVKKCFSIRRLGPVYRIHGYSECKCGMLIADTPKAKKLHICMVSIVQESHLQKYNVSFFQGSIPAFEPGIPYETENPTPPKPSPSERHCSPPRILENIVLQPKSKVWIRNFSSPIKPRGVQLLDNYSNDKPKSRTRPPPRPRVRNFDRPSRTSSPDEVCIYSIIRKNGAITVAGQSILRQHGSNENLSLASGRTVPV